MPDDLIAKMRDNGFFGLTFPEEYGGLGVDTITYAVVVEELSRASAGVSVMLTVHNSVGSYPVAMYGSEALKPRPTCRAWPPARWPPSASPSPTPAATPPP